MVAHALCERNSNAFAAAGIITSMFGRRELARANMNSSLEFFLNAMTVFSPRWLIGYSSFGGQTLSSLFS